MTNKYRVATAAELPGSQCVIGIDRDGVINRDLGTYCTRPEDFEPIPGSLEAIAELRRRGHSIVIITNQGGISKGVMTSADVDRVNSYMLDLLGNAGCTSIDAIYYSESSDKKDYYAKPNVGMFKRCQEEFKHIKFNQGFYIGDKLTDLKAAVKIGARPVLVRTGYGIETENQLNKFTYRDIKRKSYVFESLADFVEQL
jgi:D-glycero-D-manno-heptose 1,7-bisphosphate phosphatase